MIVKKGRTSMRQTETLAKGHFLLVRFSWVDCTMSYVRDKLLASGQDTRHERMGYMDFKMRM